MALIELQSAEISVVRLTLRVVRIRSSSRATLSGPHTRSSNHSRMSCGATGTHSGVPGDDLADPVSGRLRDPGVPLRHEQQDALVGPGEVREVELSVLEVVEPGDRRLEPGHHHLAQRLEAALHRRQRPAEEHVVLGLVREQLHRDLGDVAERTLVADHDVADVGAGGAARDVLDAAHLPTGEDHLAADDHVLDAAVERGELADAAGRDEPSHRCDRLRLGRVPGGEAELAGLVLEALERHPALRRRLHVVGVDRHDRVELRAVDHDRQFGATLQAALGGGTTGAGDDVDAVHVGEREHARHLVGAAHHHHRGGQRHRVHVEDVLQLAEVVDARPSQLGLVGDHLLGREEALEVFDGLGAGGCHGQVLAQWKMGYARSYSASVWSRIE